MSVPKPLLLPWFICVMMQAQTVRLWRQPEPPQMDVMDI